MLVRKPIIRLLIAYPSIGVWAQFRSYVLVLALKVIIYLLVVSTAAMTVVAVIIKIVNL